MASVTFVVEDGTGLSTATAYLSVDEIKQLWDNVGYSYGSITDMQFKQKINKATEVIEASYGALWPGYRYTETQSLGWPREDAVYIDLIEIDIDVVPPEVKKAVSEYVYASLIGGVVLQPNQAVTGTIVTESKKVDVIEISKKYSEYSSSSSVRTTVTAVKDALSRLIDSSDSGRFFNVSIERI